MLSKSLSRDSTTATGMFTFPFGAAGALLCFVTQFVSISPLLWEPETHLHLLSWVYHRIVWVGRDFKAHLFPSLFHFHPRLFQALSNLDTSRDGADLLSSLKLLRKASLTTLQLPTVPLLSFFVQFMTLCQFMSNLHQEVQQRDLCRDRACSKTESKHKYVTYFSHPMCSLKISALYLEAEQHGADSSVIFHELCWSDTTLLVCCVI